MGWLTADARPSLVKAIVALEPIGPPFLVDPNLGVSLDWGLTASPMTFDPPAASPDELEKAQSGTTGRFRPSRRGGSRRSRTSRSPSSRPEASLFAYSCPGHRGLPRAGRVPGRPDRPRRARRPRQRAPDAAGAEQPRGARADPALAGRRRAGRLVPGGRQPDRVARGDAAEPLGRVRRVAADHERPAPGVDDQAPLPGLDVTVGRDPTGAGGARGRVDLDGPVLADAGRRRGRTHGR